MSGALERTLFMIKPDAVGRGLVGAILARVEDEGFKIVAMRMVHLDAATARGFYHVHEGKPFLDSLVSFMSSGPVVATALEREGAIAKLREIVGATDPSKAEPGTIRRDYALDVEKNSVHASDAADTAKWELGFFTEHGILSIPET
jgi:nucleoside-diphosphate kinase